MGILDILQSPQGLLGLSVLGQADRPAQGLLQGLARNQQFQQQGLQQELVKAKLLQAQQESDRTKGLQQALPQSGLLKQFPQLQGLLPHVGSIPELSSLMNSVKTAERNPTLASIAMQRAGGDPELAMQFLNENASAGAPQTYFGTEGPLMTVDVPQPGGGVKTKTVRRDSQEAVDLLSKGAVESGATSLSSVEIGKLNEVGARYQTLDRLTRSFKPSFSSKIPLAQAAQNLIGARTDVFGTGEQSDWWRDYQSIRNEVRNNLFGGALTKTEADEFLKEDINTGMDPKRIETNLRRKMDIVTRAVRRMAKPLELAGKDKSQVESALGFDAIGGKFYVTGDVITQNGKKYRITSSGYDPELEEIK